MLANDKLAPADPADTAKIFEKWKLGRLTLDNRLLRSSISGRIDNYDGSGTPARVHFEEQFARGGVAAIISSHVPIAPAGRILPHYAMIDRKERVGFWKTVGRRVRAHNGCKFILQLSHSGRQQDIGGVENIGRLPDGATDQPDFFNGLRSRRMTAARIAEMVQLFADAAERVRDAELDGIELHSANGYLFTQFLSSAINDRARNAPDPYGGELKNRARFLLDVISAIQKRVGSDFPLIVKVTGHDRHNAAGLFPRPDGNGIEDAIQIAKWVEEAGVHAIHVSSGNMFPHPLNPAGDMPVQVAQRTYQSIIASGRRTFRNFLAYRYVGWFIRWLWTRKQPFWRDGRIVPEQLEGFAAADAKAIKDGLVKKIPVLLTGGFQTSRGIGEVLRNGSCDAVTIARPLLANPNLPNELKSGQNGPTNKLCSYCNKCLLHVLEHPLGCYDEDRFAPGPKGYDEMIQEVFKIFTDYVEKET